MKDKQVREGEDTLLERQKWSVFEILLILGCIGSALLMYVRAFFGIEITDEAFYISDALGMINGNLPYALNNFSLAVGNSFLFLPLLKLYTLFVPDHAGILLFSRICFVSFHLLCAVWSGIVISRSTSRASALLFTGCQIPFFVSGILNFSYNTVPASLGILIAVLVFDATEGSLRHSRRKLFLSGFISGICVFAHPGYACEVILLLILISIRSGKGKRLESLFYYAAGGLLEILFVFIPLLCQVGAAALWNGLSSMMGSKFVQEPISSLTGKEKLLQVWMTARYPSLVMLLSALAVVPFGLQMPGESREKNRCSAILFGISVGLLISILLFVRLYRRNDLLYILGIIGAVAVILILLCGLQKEFPLVLYLGIYSIIYALIEVVYVTSAASVSRFWACLPALFAVLLFLQEKGKHVVKYTAVLISIACILVQGFNLYAHPYREARIRDMTQRVNCGVYKGLYTTPASAEDVQQLESFLNTVIGKDDYYAFRDNAPCGYLMTHSGKMCDASSWDILQYTYGHNTPSKLFDYYKRRGAVPDVIVYLDYGRDEILSVDDHEYRYNDFLNKYYRLTDNCRLNETFQEIKVFRYSGGFDGDYDTWICRYNSIPVPDEEPDILK